MPRVPLSALKPAPWNPRTISDERFKNLCRSIEADPGLLDLRPILARKDGTIYGGNMRYRAVQHLGWQDVPADLADIPERLAKERALRDNGSWGEWTDDLSSLLNELKTADAAIELLGFDDDELTRLLAEPKVLNSDDADLTPPVEPITKPGDLWLLGEHRLLCGDATNADDVARLMDGERADLGLCDPPYNVGEDYATFVDVQSEQEYESFSRVWFGLLQQHSTRQIVTPGCNNLARWCRYFDPYHVAPWTKTNSMTNGKVARWWCWEPILFYGEHWGRDRSNDVFEFAIGQQKDVGDHPCPKPLTFWQDLITNYSAAGAGASVVDLFMGVGTAIIAAEQSERVCYGLESDPAYCDVAVRRWEHVSGRQAVKENA